MTTNNGPDRIELDTAVQATAPRPPAPSPQPPAPSHRAYAGEADLPAVVALVLAADAVDRLDLGQGADELRMQLTDPNVDAARDIRLWASGDGALVAFAHLELPPGGDAVDGFLRYDIHPEHRTDALDDAIVTWATDRLREVAAERGGPARLGGWVREEHTARRAALERHGLRVVRHFPTLERPLTTPIDVPEAPEGFSIRPLTGPDEAAAWVEMFDESFVDHYNFHPDTTESMQHWLTDPNHRPEMNLVAAAPDGRLAGFCWCMIFAEENARTGRNEGWIELLGTRRGYRRMGVGRALVLSGLLALRDAGVDAARLGVDADSPTGATRLYAAAGFRPIYTYLAYMKDLET